MAKIRTRAIKTTIRKRGTAEPLSEGDLSKRREDPDPFEPSFILALLYLKHGGTLLRKTREDRYRKTG
jgi:hypothetical protein